MATDPDDPGIGSETPRREDTRVLLGESKGTDDIELSDPLHAQFIRSENAHARYTIDAADARAMDGVVAVYTADDIEASETPTPRPFTLFAAPMTGLDYPDEALWQRCLGAEKAHYHGEILGVVVAETQRIARDALAAVDVSYDTLDPVVTPQLATTLSTPS